MIFSFRIFILLFCFFYPINQVFSQQKVDRITSNFALAEKIYLQLDKKVYFTNDNIWFKAILTNAATNVPSALSKVLYVELIAPDERVVEKKLIKIENGIGHNFFHLDPSVQEGKYLVRAYTHWNRNFGNNFIFSRYIDVFTSSGKVENDAIDKLKLIKGKDATRLIARIDPYQIDKNHENELGVYLDFISKKDTLLLKAQKDSTYLLDYPVPSGAELVSVTLQTSNAKRYIKSISLQEEKPDVQFFPEGEKLLYGLMNRIGIKASNNAGQGIQITGKIFDDQNQEVESFQTNELGRGDLSLFASANSYYALIYSEKTNDTIRYDFPEVMKKGTNLLVDKRADVVRLLAVSNNLVKDSLFIDVSARGVNYYMIKGKLKKGSFYTTISSKILPNGIIALKLLDAKKNILAKRIFFNKKPEELLSIKINTNKPEFDKREKAKLGIEVTDNEGKPVKANLSLLVINKDLIRSEENFQSNILSYFLLESEFESSISQPGFYLGSDEKEHEKNLNLLMLTDGVGNYIFQKSAETPFQYAAEKSLHLSGHLSSASASKDKEDLVSLNMITFGEKKNIYNENLTNKNSFDFILDDEFSNNVNAVIQSTSNEKKNRYYKVVLDKQTEPEIHFNHTLSILPVDNHVRELVQKQKERKVFDDSFDALSGVTELDQVDIEAPGMSPQHQKVLNRYGKAETIIPGESIQEKEKNWSYGLYSVLLFNFADKIRIERDSTGELRAKVMNGEESLVVVDGIPVKEYSYDFIPIIPPSEVKSVEIIEYAKNFSNLYSEVHPEASLRDAPMTGNVIAIYTESGKGLFGVDEAPGMLATSIPVYAANKEFEQPKYENIAVRNSKKPDLRSVIDWEPEILTNPQGKAPASYYNSDISGKMLIIIEAISEDGKIGYQSLTYEVN